MKEEIIIRGCQQGEHTAQRLLFDKYYSYVYTICHRYLKNHHDSQDVVLMIFNRIYKNIAKVTETQNNGVKKWIQTISINESIRFIKRKSPVVYTEDQFVFDQVDSDNSFDYDVDIDLIKKLIEEMPEGYRRIFLLKVVEGLTHEEIARHLSISQNTSKSQLLKARKYLQKEMKNYESQKI